MQLANIEDVARAVRICRAKGVRTYPEALWQRIGEQCRRYSIPEVSRQTGISVHYLQRRVGRRPAPSRFCELSVEAPIAARSEHTVVAVRRRDGSEMAIELKGTLDIGRAVAEFIRS